MMGSELEEFAKRLRDGVAASPMTAESMQVLAERMQELGGMQLAKGTGAQTGSNQQGRAAVKTDKAAVEVRLDKTVMEAKTDKMAVEARQGRAEIK